MEQNKVNVSELNINELKALAYDELVKINVANNNLRVLNQELSQRQQQGDSTASPVVVKPLNNQ